MAANYDWLLRLRQSQAFLTANWAQYHQEGLTAIAKKRWHQINLISWTWRFY
ncbi:MAG: hypothetical protein IPG70_16425 [Moraxellaceae bacterium]|nr:hypothetical protein [Moraxellaceae bacterium]